MKRLWYSDNISNLKTNTTMDQTAKQQVVERLKAANNVLVTVSNNPSVDQLAAAIAMTIMINAMGKHATAVFSGKVPDTMRFLNPTKTLEETVDSLRDFIIALDKEKADKLRYKIEDDVVKIFITPYRTRISEADLVFSQGDYNVDAVLALGVHKKDDLDKIIVEHGRILHDAAVISVNTGPTPGDLGSINWLDASASSLCEMMMSISEALQAGLVDQQVATALLTGIVSETDRFSNEKTTPKVMTMSAQLMAAGANQQLIATNLHPVINAASAVTTPKPEVQKDPSEMAISHKDADLSTEVTDDESAAHSEKTDTEEKPKTLEDIENTAASSKSSENPTAQLVDLPTPVPVSPGDSEIDKQKTEPPAQSGLPSSLPPGPIADMIHDTKGFSQPRGSEAEKPLLGGTFNATTNDAHDNAIKAAQAGENNTILDHGLGDAEATPPSDSPTSTNSVAAPASDPAIPAWQPPARPPGSTIPTAIGQDDFSKPFDSLSGASTVGENNPLPAIQSLDGERLATIDEATKQSEAAGESDTLGSLDLESAREAVEAAMGSADFDPSNNPRVDVGSTGEVAVHDPFVQPQQESPAPIAPPDVPPPFGAPPAPAGPSSFDVTPPPTPPPFAAPPSAPPTATSQNNPSPNDFTLPTA